MALEQVRRREAYELPLQELHSLAPDISWGHAPTISPDFSPVEVCQVVGEWYVAHSSDVRRREAVTSHGPVLHKRGYELEKLLKQYPAKLVYISAFHNFAEFRRHTLYIAWETEVWIAEMPEHMIHYNGERFLGPADNGVLRTQLTLYPHARDCICDLVKYFT